MTDDELRLIIEMLMHGTPTEKEYASKRLDDWFIADQHKYIESKAQELKS